MKHTKLFSDNRPVNQQPGTYPFGKNGIQFDSLGAILNELGFEKQPATIPYQVNGIIETDEHPILFSTNDTDSSIGFFNRETGEYNLILDDVMAGFKLGFKADHYITGEYQKNSFGEVQIVWTDKHTPIKYLNVTKANEIDSPEDILFFPKYSTGKLSVVVQDGGALQRGSYSVTYRYRNFDGLQTAFQPLSNPSSVSSVDGNINTTKALLITLENPDQDFDEIEFAIVMKINGVASAVALPPVPNSQFIQTVFSGTDFTTDLVLEEVLANPVVYTNVGCMGQLNDSLYLGDLKRAPKIPYQKYANLIKVRGYSKLINGSPIDPDAASGKLKGFAHEEVYALYIRLGLDDGTITDAFHIPGRPDVTGDLVMQSIQGGTSNHPKFQIDDTARNIDVASKSFDPGYWENDAEVYPNTEDFNSTAYGGEDLRGQPVRHHRMPSISFCKQYLYPSEIEYGRTKIDLLGLEITNVTFPTELAGRVLYYEILYAERGGTNMTVLGQSVYHYGHQMTTALKGPVVSAGGNWQSRNANKDADNDWVNETRLYPSTKYMRLLPFDVMFNRPAIAPSYIRFQLKLRNNEPTGYSNTPNAPMTIDYTSKEDAVSPTVPAAGDRTREVVSSRYLNSMDMLGDLNNSFLESCFFVEYKGIAPTMSFSSGLRYFDEDQYHHAYYPAFEETYLVNLMSLKTELYAPFYTQRLVRTGLQVPATQSYTGIMYLGDVYACEYTTSNYGWAKGRGGGGWIDGYEDPHYGWKVARKFLCESISNINLRFEIPGDNYSKWWPKAPMSNKRGYLYDADRSFDINKLGYSKELNAVNNINAGQPANPFDEDVFEFPFRIHRGGKQERTGDSKNWRTFRALDFYEDRKNLGRIINLCGQDDKLLIHHEHALLVTQDKAALESDSIGVTLGSGDIFQFDPQEAMSSKSGFAGTQHDLGCLQTTAGYLFTDAKQGQLFLYKNGLHKIDTGISNFLQDFFKGLVEKNPFYGNGVTWGFDPEQERVLLTVKNKKLVLNTENIITEEFEETAEYFAQLVPGESIVYKDGRYQLFLGVNTTPYTCGTNLPPVVVDAIFTLPENATTGTIVGLLPASDPNGDPVSLYILSGNDGGAFSLNTTTHQLTVANPAALNFVTKPVYTLVVKGYDPQGLSDTGTITINLTEAVPLPVVGSKAVTIDEGKPIGYVVEDMEVTHRYATVYNWTIISGNDLNQFTINSGSGVVSVLNNDSLDYETNPYFELRVRATVASGPYTGQSGEGTLQISLVNVAEPMSWEDSVFSVNKDEAIGYSIGIVPAAVPSDITPTAPLVYTVVTGDSRVNFNPLTRELTVASALGPVDTFDIVLRATNPLLEEWVESTVTINITGAPITATIQVDPGIGGAVTSVVISNSKMTYTFDGFNNAGEVRVETITSDIWTVTITSSKKAISNVSVDGTVLNNGAPYTVEPFTAVYTDINLATNFIIDINVQAKEWMGINPICQKTQDADISPFQAPYVITYVPSVDALFVTNYDGTNVTRINAATRTIATTIGVINSKGRAIVYKGSGNNILVTFEVSPPKLIDVTTNTVVASGTVAPSYSVGASYMPTWDRYAIPDTNGFVVRLYDPTTLAVTNTIAMSEKPLYIREVTATKVYVSGINNTIMVIDMATKLEVSAQKITLPNGAGSTDFTSNMEQKGNNVYVLGTGTTKRFYVIDALTNAVIFNKPLTNAADRLLYSASRDRLYITETTLVREMEVSDPTYPYSNTIVTSGFTRLVDLEFDTTRDYLYASDHGNPLSGSPGTKVAVFTGGVNTGQVFYQDLQQNWADSDLPTGVTKPNDYPNDVDSIAPSTNLTICPTP